ncbi:MAG TPA: Holliday junction resolvase RuvX [Bacteroidales bacterium]|nr:Holliday junction resolvase RuvX [Bacteroidales bacterium]
MGRIIAIDYGQKLVGIAVTDELQITANALTTIHSKDILNFLSEYIAKENVECIVVGEPKQLDDTESQSEKFIIPFLKQLQKLFPLIPIKRYDERFTSKMAFQTMIDAGLKKQDRKNKLLLNSISATIILQSYLESIQSNNTKRE